MAKSKRNRAGDKSGALPFERGSIFDLGQRGLVGDDPKAGRRGHKWFDVEKSGKGMKRKVMRSMKGDDWLIRTKRSSKKPSWRKHKYRK
jgi:hypothetical protein